MEKIYEKTLLYDFYGELLTPRQREVFEGVVFNDMSLSEAAKEFSVSRQGVYDMLRRCEESLADYEKKLHMIEQYEKIRNLTAKLLKNSEKAGDLDAFRKCAMDVATKIQKEIS